MRAEEELIAAQTALAVQLRYARAGISLAQAALAGAHECVELRHYPAGDVIDTASGTQFYYHAHGSSRRPADEHGHFHLFLREPGTAATRDPARFSHVVALSLDARGLPLRWFCVNRWVSGEQWRSAESLIDDLPRLHPRARGRLAPVAQWLDALLRLDATRIATLLRRRDAVIARQLARRDAESVFEDRRLDVLTECAISLPQRLARLAGSA